MLLAEKDNKVIFILIFSIEFVFYNSNFSIKQSI
jgi:hypothetical protein